MRHRGVFSLVVAAMLGGALAGASATPRRPGGGSEAPPMRNGAGAQSDDLPEGPGKTILQTSCTACHELTEVTKFKGYYTRDEWRDVVKTMIEYGAVVKPADVDVLVEYLTKNLGKKPTAAAR